MSWIWHICLPQAWEDAQSQGQYRADSLKDEGFIHCSTGEQIQGVISRFYRDVEDLILLKIDPHQVEAEIRWEEAEGDQYPHILWSLKLGCCGGIHSHGARHIGYP